MSHPNYHHVLMGLHKPQRCQIWPFQLVPCIVRIPVAAVEPMSIIDAVCEAHSVTVEQLSTKTRKRPIVKARQIAMHFLKKYTKLTLHQIGEILGGYDRTTVIHSDNVVEELKSSYQDYKNDLTQLETKIKYRL